MVTNTNLDYQAFLQREKKKITKCQLTEANPLSLGNRTEFSDSSLKATPGSSRVIRTVCCCCCFKGVVGRKMNYTSENGLSTKGKEGFFQFHELITCLTTDHRKGWSYIRSRNLQSHIFLSETSKKNTACYRLNVDSK